MWQTKAHSFFFIFKAFLLLLTSIYLFCTLFWSTALRPRETCHKQSSTVKPTMYSLPLYLVLAPFGILAPRCTAAIQKHKSSVYKISDSRRARAGEKVVVNIYIAGPPRMSRLKAKRNTERNEQWIAVENTHAGTLNRTPSRPENRRRQQR